MTYNKYEPFLIKEIIDKIDNGQSKKSLAKIYNIPRGTITSWYKTKDKFEIDILKEYFDSLNNESYSYVLGLYLGDGYIDKMKRTYRLRIALNSKQDLVISECIKNLEIIFPKNKVNVRKRKYNCVVVYVYSNILPYVFPQHGIGKKHERDIILQEFQKERIINNKLMLGLFHSDGSFYVAINKYPRYQFTNKSQQIIDIFLDCLKELEIEAKPKTRKNGIIDIPIQKRKYVNILYPILGEKYVARVGLEPTRTTVQ